MYDENFVQPMRQELTKIGFQELKNAAEVENTINTAKGTVAIAINSVCGCAAGCFRPGINIAMQNTSKRPELLTTVFAGQEPEATAKAREYIIGYPPSSPCFALLKDGELVFMLERKDIQGKTPDQLGQDIKTAFEKYC